MRIRSELQLIAAMASGFLLAFFVLWLFQFAWQKAGERDASGNRAPVKNQLMRQKSASMDDVLHEVVYGRLRNVSAAAQRMKDCAHAIDGFLATEIYSQHGENFYKAIDDVKTAADAADRDAVKEAILRLEKSCIECHYLINQPQ